MYIVDHKNAFENGIITNGSAPYINYNQTSPIETFNMVKGRYKENNETSSYLYEEDNPLSVERQPQLVIRFIKSQKSIMNIAMQMQDVMSKMNEQVRIVEFGNTSKFVLGYVFKIDTICSGSPLNLMYSENQWIVLQNTKILIQFPVDTSPLIVLAWCWKEMSAEPNKSNICDAWILTNSVDIKAITDDMEGYIMSSTTGFKAENTDENISGTTPTDNENTPLKSPEIASKPDILMTPQETREKCIQQLTDAGFYIHEIDDIISEVVEEDYTSKSNYCFALRSHVKKMVAKKTNTTYQTASVEDFVSAFTSQEDSRMDQDKKKISITAEQTTITTISSADNEPEPVEGFENKILVNETIQSPFVIHFKNLPSSLKSGTTMTDDDVIRMVDYSGVMITDNKYLIQENKIDFPIVHVVNVKLLNGSSMFGNSISYQAVKNDISCRGYVLYFVDNEYLIVRLP
jgi:hypothetical protein